MSILRPIFSYRILNLHTEEKIPLGLRCKTTRSHYEQIEPLGKKLVKYFVVVYPLGVKLTKKKVPSDFFCSYT